VPEDKRDIVTDELTAKAVSQKDPIFLQISHANADN
jgi:hypothetical protein